jgi:hypothetical protein
VFVHHVRSDVHPEHPLILEVRATKEVSCKVVVAIKRDASLGFVLTSAVQYQDGDKWYAKDGAIASDMADALKRAYGLSRKVYNLAASRALAGLLYDSVVPATDDIDC